MEALLLQPQTNLAVLKNPTNYQQLSATELLQQLISNALLHLASDLHLEPQAQNFRVRARIDGLLHQITTLPSHIAPTTLARIKVLAKMDLSEQRLPQDGHFTFNHTEIRVSSCPTEFGEKIVLRFLGRAQSIAKINQLGMTTPALLSLKNALASPNGMVLITGPTGSGKTTTLYAAIDDLNDEKKSIMTAEDPIEIHLPGITQVQVKPKIGLDYTSILKAFLRQDPDILMLGEIRDAASANMSFRAALTGHLVLSTLHTNSALQTITRLQTLGIEPFLIAHTLKLITAQRLLRLLCQYCKKNTKNGYHEANPNGCPHCQKGYQGRIGIFEHLPVTPIIQAHILNESSEQEIKDSAEKEGFLSLFDAAMHLAQQGLTDLTEIQRVLGKYES